MANPTKSPVLICVILTIMAAIGMGVGLLAGPLVPNEVREFALQLPIFALLPSVGYLVLWTKGDRTHFVSWVIAAVYAVTLVLRFFQVNLDVGALFGRPSLYLYLLPYTVPLTDIKVIAISVVIVLSLVLILRARSVYARWLGGIMVTSFAIVYLLAWLEIQDRFEGWGL